jgi:F-type H+-transporting ATPase subunit delta
MRFFLSPEAMAHQKHAFIQAVFEGRVDASVVGALRLLVDKGRSRELPAICREFRRLWEEHQGLVRVQVQTAFPLAQDQEERLKNELQKLSGLDVILEKKINKAMIGGIIVLYRDKIIDNSVRRGLRQLREAMMAAES